MSSLTVIYLIVIILLSGLWKASPYVEISEHKRRVQETQAALGKAQNALYVYLYERHSFPGTLEELVPDYLNKVPDDPFAKGKSLRYIPLKDDFLLYSVGPDGKDDGGRPINDPSRVTNEGSSHARYQIMETSKGDIVIAINDY
ncbi:MAG: hypothetical protein KY468_15000 [Armatimonadetes bacterium]|nr:hypothetical protein [Armatimonadota bacterium]